MMTLMQAKNAFDITVGAAALWLGNVLLFLQKVKSRADDAIECHERLGGLLRYYHRNAASI